ncbi:MAG TPA: response regulator [Burkholderiales bacterium]|nr:response regulator [Burkholderiales bacterium]
MAGAKIAAEDDDVFALTDKGVAELKGSGTSLSPAEPREAKDGWQPTIFVVDDDMDLLKLVRTYFKLEGFRTRIATKKAEIMAGFRQQPMPDLVLLDIALPDADGFEVLARMREHAALKSMPVILLTGQATRGAVAKGLRAGADGYITKPFEPDALVTAVKEVLGLVPGKDRRKAETSARP